MTGVPDPDYPLPFCSQLIITPLNSLPSIPIQGGYQEVFPPLYFQILTTTPFEWEEKSHFLVVLASNSGFRPRSYKRHYGVWETDEFDSERAEIEETDARKVALFK